MLQGILRTGRPRDPRWLAAAEALGVLAACMVVILVSGGILGFALAPRTHDAVYELEPARAVADPLPDLVERVRALGLAQDVSVRERGGNARLFLRGLVSTEDVDARVGHELRRAGYLSVPARIHSWPDAQGLVREHAALVVGVQSAILLLFGGIGIVLRVRRADPGARAGWPRAVLYGVAAGAVGFVASATLGALQRALGLGIEEQEWLRMLLSDRDALPALVPWLVLVAPLAEEVFFRGYLFRFLHQRAGTAAAYLLSAACFSVIHLHLPGLVVYFLVGLIFAYVCRRTATLAAPVAAHVTYNGAALALALLLTRP